MKVNHRSFGVWRSLIVALIVFGFLLLGTGARASAQSATVTYNYLAGAGFLCPDNCPDVSSAPNGDTISISGQGTLSINPNSVTGGGTFIHKDASGIVLAMGTWTAQQLLSFVSYGTMPGVPPNFEGGKALLRIHLSPNTGGAGFDGVLRITCLIGSPPPAGGNEGIRLNVQDVINFNTEVSGETLFIRQ